MSNDEGLSPEELAEMEENFALFQAVYTRDMSRAFGRGLVAGALLGMIVTLIVT